MKLPRPRVHARLRATLDITAYFALGIAAAGTIHAVASGNWLASVWAAVASLCIVLVIVIQQRTPSRPERGAVGLHFTGGPLDGADIPMPPFPGHDLLDARIDLYGTTYRVTTVHHTCYRAEAEATR